MTRTRELQDTLLEMTDNYTLSLIVEQLSVACQRQAQHAYANDDTALGNAWAKDGEALELLIPTLER